MIIIIIIMIITILLLLLLIIIIIMIITILIIMIIIAARPPDGQVISQSQHRPISSVLGVHSKGPNCFHMTSCTAHKRCLYPSRKSMIQEFNACITTALRYGGVSLRISENA